MLNRAIQFVKLLLIWSTLLLVFGVFLELGFRVYDWTSSPGEKPKDRILHEVNPYFGVWHKANQINKTHRRKGCMEVRGINFNSLGMRAEELNASKGYKVGYFGDSMIEGDEVPNEEHFIYQLNSVDKTTDHLNFGMKATGTTHQYYNYKYHSEKVKLDEVVLCLYLSNDIWNNAYAISVQNNWEPNVARPYFVKNEQGKYKLTRSQIKAHSHWFYSLKLIQKIKSSLERLNARLFADQPVVCKVNGATVPFNRQVYLGNCSNPSWEQGLRATALSLILFRNECEKNGADFRVLLLPSWSDFGYIEKQDEGKAYLPDLDFDRKNRLFKKFMDKAHIPYNDYIKWARAHVSKQKLQFPFLSHTCDMHYSSKGHALLFDYLRTQPQAVQFESRVVE